jgi:hypothetical protein
MKKNKWTNIILTVLILFTIGFVYFTWRRYQWYNLPYSSEINTVLFMAGDNRKELEKFPLHAISLFNGQIEAEDIHGMRFMTAKATISHSLTKSFRDIRTRVLPCPRARFTAELSRYNKKNRK